MPIYLTEFPKMGPINLDHQDDNQCGMIASSLPPVWHEIDGWPVDWKTCGVLQDKLCVG